MSPLKAQVRNGRLVLDAPTDLPEGQVVYLQPVDDDEAEASDLERLHDSLRTSIEELHAGETIDITEARAQLRAHR